MNISNTFGALGELIDSKDIPSSLCAVKVKTKNESFYCSGTLVNRNSVKTAAHCLKHMISAKVLCASGEKSRVTSFKIHPKFILSSSFVPMNMRKYDHAILKLKKMMTLAKILPSSFSNKKIKKIVASNSECVFFGVGLNPWVEGTGFLHGVKTTSSKIILTKGIIIINDPFSAVSMVGDSGASLFCKDVSHKSWINIGTISAHSWDNETLVASNETFEEIPPTPKLLYNKNINYFKQKIVTTKRDIRFRILPFSSYTQDGKVYNLADRKLSRFKINKIEKPYAIGSLEHFGPSKYYLCGEGISCTEFLYDVKIKLDRLIINNKKTILLDLRFDD